MATPTLPSDTSLYLVNNIDTAHEMLRWLGERHHVIGLDTETTGLDENAPGAALRLVQIGDEKTGWAIPWEGWGGAAMEVLNKWQGPIALHNAAFDVRWMQRHANWDVPWHRIHDTMIMAQIDRPGKRAALKPLGNEFVDPRADAGQVLLKEAMSKNGWDWATVPVELDAYWGYSALDPIITVHLYNHFRTDQKYPRVYDLEMAARRIISGMEAKGARIDIAYCEHKLKQLTEYVDSSKAWAKENWGVSIGSAQQLVKFFLGLGAEITRETRSGAPSMDKYQLRMFAQQQDRIGEAARFILNVRKADKLATAYFSNFLNMHHDGILHPTIKTLGARTGRMSVTDPALQTLPKGEAVVRDAFIPVNEGDIMVSSDYSQIEMRLMAHFSRDKRLISAFLDADSSGGDFFVNMGKDIYQDPSFSKADKRRGLVKSTMYGLAYGAGVQKMAETAGVPFDQMKMVTDAVDQTYPGIKQFMREIEDIGVRREKEEGEGYVLTPFGRRLPSDKGRVYSLTNYILQGHAAELLKEAIVRMDAAGLSQYMLLPIHDEIIFSIPRSEHKEVMNEIARTMSITEGYSVPVPSDPEGPLDRWGQKYREDEFDRSYEESVG